MVSHSNATTTTTKKRAALKDITAAALTGSHPYLQDGGKRKRACSSTSAKEAGHLPAAPRRVTRRTASAAAATATASAVPLPPSSATTTATSMGADDTSRRLYAAPASRHDGKSDDLLACDEALEQQPLSQQPQEEEEQQQASFESPSTSTCAGAAFSSSVLPSAAALDVSCSTHSSSSAATAAASVPPGIVDIDDTLQQQQQQQVHHQAALAAHAGKEGSTPQRLETYSRDYFTYLREREREQQDRPSPEYLARVQGSTLTQDMRALLVDWLVTVTVECELMPSTLYHCVELVDRALSKLRVPKEQLQCLGCACLFIACKFEETSVPSLDEFTYMAAESFTKKELTDLELRVVEALSFRVSTVTAYNFLPRFTLAAGSRPRETALVHYLSELTLLHYDFLAFAPSVRAAAALYLARQTLAAQTPDPVRRAAEERNVWTPTIAYYTGYMPATDLPLQACVRLLRKAHAGAELSSYEALRLKFSDSTALHAAEISYLEEGQLGF